MEKLPTSMGANRSDVHARAVRSKAIQVLRGQRVNKLSFIPMVTLYVTTRFPTLSELCLTLLLSNVRLVSVSQSIQGFYKVWSSFACVLQANKCVLAQEIAIQDGYCTQRFNYGTRRWKLQALYPRQGPATPRRVDPYLCRQVNMGVSGQ